MPSHTYSGIKANCLGGRPPPYRPLHPLRLLHSSESVPPPRRLSGAHPKILVAFVILSVFEAVCAFPRWGVFRSCGLFGLWGIFTFRYFGHEINETTVKKKMGKRRVRQPNTHLRGEKIEFLRNNKTLEAWNWRGECFGKYGV